MVEKTQPNPDAPPDAESQGESTHVNRQHKDRVVMKATVYNFVNTIHDHEYAVIEIQLPLFS